MGQNREDLFFSDRSALRNWLANNFDKEEGVWAVFYKKSTGLSDLSWEAIVEECLCFGWIDSLPGKVDEHRTKIYISPRKANSGWSRRNKELLVDLKKRGLIESPGVAAIDRAKANGSWERFDLAEALVIPNELQSALGEEPDFASNWKALSDSKKKQSLQQIYDAKTEGTRLKRINALRQALGS
jgi:uncharacterized protein YdeI (YjbR/CyaY-like superfamily)